VANAEVIVLSGSRFWARGRDREQESETADGGLAGALTAVDRCDRCGAQAYVRALLPNGLELLFCAHHNRQHSSGVTYSSDLSFAHGSSDGRTGMCRKRGLGAASRR